MVRIWDERFQSKHLLRYGWSRGVREGLNSHGSSKVRMGLVHNATGGVGVVVVVGVGVGVDVGVGVG